MEKKFVIKSEWIKEVIEKKTDKTWYYDYKEYIFNENYKEAYSLRIPQWTVGIPAMLFSNNSGLEEEYDIVELENGKTETIFDISKCVEHILVKKVEKLESENDSLKGKLEMALFKLELIKSTLG